MDRWAALAVVAQAQYGVVTRAQAAELGIPKSTLHGQVRARGWRRLHDGVYALAAWPDNPRQRMSAALWAAGPQALLTRVSAAAHYGLLPMAETVDLLLPASLQSRRLAGVRTYRSETLMPADRASLNGLAVTSPPRTLIDLAAVLEQERLRAVLIDAVQRRLVTPTRVARRLEKLGPVRGRGVLRTLLWEMDAERCDSVLERKVRMALRSQGVPEPHPTPWPVQVGGRTLHIDIAWPSARTGVEVDGFAYHSDRAALERDHRRLNTLTLAGWRIMRVSWLRIGADPAGVAAEVRRLLKA